MPTVSVERARLWTHLGRTYTDTAFDALCFEFGIELDEITSERHEALKQQQQNDPPLQNDTNSSRQQKEKRNLTCSSFNHLSDEVIYKIDVPANRYDLLCIEGLSRALKIFLGDMPSPTYVVDKDEANNSSSSNSNNMTTITVMKQHVDTVRPYVVAAILRNLTFTPERYTSFLDLQEQLHRNVCRHRTLVAIGTHDLDTLKGPFVYDAQPPSRVHFVPLTTPVDLVGPVSAEALMHLYETDPTCKHLKPYVSIVKHAPLLPVIYDAHDVVLSVPPLINGAHSKMTLDTKNVLIECTATDRTKANIVLDILCCMFSEYCAVPFHVEPVRVNYVVEVEEEMTTLQASYVTPLLSTRQERMSIDFCNSLIGMKLPPEQMQALCNKMQLGPATLLDQNTLLQVTVPPTRSDILHPVDIAEDLAIAYGYNHIVKRVPQTCTVGREVPMNHLTDLLRSELAQAGYTEVLTHGLCSIQDNFTWLRRRHHAAAASDNHNHHHNHTPKAVSLSNPANSEYQVIRTTLLPGLLKTLQHNKSSSFMHGYKIFEISDVVLPDPHCVFTDTVVGTRNVRRVCALYAGPTSGFEVIHGLVDRIMTLCEVSPEAAYRANSIKGGDEELYRVSRDGWEYTITSVVHDDHNNNIDHDGDDDDDDDEKETFFPGRAAHILLTTRGRRRRKIGVFGILHPEVLSNFDIQYPASCVELDLEALL